MQDKYCGKSKIDFIGKDSYLGSKGRSALIYNGHETPYTLTVHFSKKIEANFQ